MSRRAPLLLLLVRLADSDVRDLERSGSDPAWSPDGRTIAFAQGTNNLINFIPAEGGSVTGIGTIGTGEGVQELSWSSDGAKLAFNHYVESEGTEIYVINRDGTAMTNLSNEPVAADHPDWSPRG